MTNETTPKTGIRRLWPDGLIWRIIVVVVVIYVLASLLLLTARVDSSDAAVRPLTKPSQVRLGLPAAVYVATLKNLRLHPNSAVAGAILNLTEVVDSTGLNRSARFTKKCPAGAPKGCSTDHTDGYKPVGCHQRTVWRKSSIRIRLVHLEIGWRRTSIDGWCWNRKRITWTGSSDGDDGKGAIFPYCWDNATSKQEWVTLFWQKRVYNQGTLRVCGKLSPQITVKPRIYFKRGDYWNYG
jgi:hypothetical protein